MISKAVIYEIKVDTDDMEKKIAQYQANQKILNKSNPY